MKQYYVLAQKQSGELRYWIWPAENAEHLIHDFGSSYLTKDQVIVNFAVMVPGEPEPDWFRRKEPEEQLGLFEEAINS